MASDTAYTRYASLADRVVVVTGGATGIGAEIVVAFVQQRARVHFLDIQRGAGEALAASLMDATFHACDLRDIPALRVVLADIERDESAIDVLVNNAASDDRHAMADVEPDYWRERMATNLDHQFFATQAVAPGMAARGRGSIVMTSSTSWLRGRPGMVAYTTAKSAVSGLARTLSRELGPQGIRVNCVVPGAVLTERQEQLWEDADASQAILEDQALKRRLQPSHVASAVLFLAADDSGGCTGVNLMVDAGIT